MKFTTSAILSIAAAALAMAAPTTSPNPASPALLPRTEGKVTYISSWNEAGMKRYRYAFTGCCTADWGQEFLHAFQNVGGVTNNWQCWNDPTLGWVFDNSEVDGAVGADIIRNGINQVTGQTCDQIGFIGCGA